jgi:YD repeat-containing protein
MKYIRTIIALCLVSSGFAEAQCDGKDCGKVEITNLSVSAWSDAHPEIPTYFKVDGYQIPTEPDGSGEHAFIPEPPVTVWKNKVFHINMTPFQRDSEDQYSDCSVSMALGCGTREVEINGMTMKFPEDTLTLDSRDLRSNVVDLSGEGIYGATAALYKTGCKVLLSIEYDCDREVDFAVKVVDPEALSGCQLQNFGSMDGGGGSAGGFGGSASGSGGTTATSPIWNSTNPLDATNLENWVYRGDGVSLKNNPLTRWQVLTDEALYDMEDFGGGVKVSTYALNQVGAIANGFHDQTGKTKSEEVTYTEVSGKLQIVVERNNEVVSATELQSESLGGSPVVTRRVETDLLAGTRKVLIDTAATGVSGEEFKTTIAEEWYDASGSLGFQLISRIRTTYQNSAFGYRAIEEIVDPTYPDRALPANLITKTFYVESDGGLITYPDGSWMLKSTSDWMGTLNLHDGLPDPNQSTFEVLLQATELSSATYRPYLNGSLTGAFPVVSLPALSDCTVDVEYGYDNGTDWIEASATITEGMITARRDHWRTEESVFGQTYKVDHYKTYDRSGSSRTSETWYKVTDIENDFGTLYKTINADGTGKQYAYAKGNYDGGEFVEGPGDFSQTSEWDIGAVLTSDPALATRLVTVKDPRGRLVDRRKQAYLGGGSYETMTRDTWVYTQDVNGRTIGTEQYTDGLLMSRETQIGQTSTQQSAGGPLVTTVRDSQDRVISVTQTVAGRPDIITNYLYPGLVETVITSAGGLSRSYSSQRDLAGRVASETDEHGVSQSYRYADGGRTVTLTRHSQNGPTRITASYKDGRQQSITGTAVVPVYFSYSINSMTGFVSTTEYTGSNPSPRFVETTEDWSGRTVATIRPSPTEVGNVTEERLYDTKGRLWKIDFGTEQSDELFTYDSLGNLKYHGLDLAPGGLVFASTDRITEVIRGYQKIDEIWWDVETNKRYRTDNNGTNAYTTIYRRAIAPVATEEGARWMTITVPPGGLTHTEFKDEFFLNQSVVTTRDSSATSVFPDQRMEYLGGLLMSASDYGAGNPSIYEYDALGRQVKVTDPRGGSTEYIYNPQGRIWKVIDPTRNSTVYDYYDSNHQNAGMVSDVTNAEGEVITSVYDMLGRIKFVGGTGAYPIEYAYNGYGDMMTHKTTRNGTDWDTTTWNPQDGTGLLNAKIYPGGKKTSYSYHSHGKVHVRTWERGVATTYSYNGALDVVGINYSDSTPDVTLDLDRLGRPKSITDGGGVVTRGYHASLPVVESDTYSSGHAWLPDAVMSYTWDVEDARRTVVRLDWGSGSSSTTATYDPVTGHVSSYTGASTFRHEYTYAAGTALITEINHLNGATSRGTETRRTDLAGRLYGIYTKNAAGTTVSRTGYKMDRAGRRTLATRENAEYWLYGYNDRGEVTKGKKHLPNGDHLAGHQFEYEYDDIGNRKTSRSGGDSAGENLRTFGYTADEKNQYSSLTTPATFDVIGRSPVAPGDSLASSLGPVERQGEHYRVQGTASNSMDSEWKAVSVTYTPQVGPLLVKGGSVYIPESVTSVNQDRGTVHLSKFQRDNLSGSG